MAKIILNAEHKILLDDENRVKVAANDAASGECCCDVPCGCGALVYRGPWGTRRLTVVGGDDPRYSCGWRWDDETTYEYASVVVHRYSLASPWEITATAAWWAAPPAVGFIVWAAHKSGCEGDAVVTACYYVEHYINAVPQGDYTCADFPTAYIDTNGKCVGLSCV